MRWWGHVISERKKCKKYMNYRILHVCSNLQFTMLQSCFCRCEKSRPKILDNVETVVLHVRICNLPCFFLYFVDVETSSSCSNLQFTMFYFYFVGVKKAETVVPLYSELCFRRMFRMSRSTFEICNYLKYCPEL